MAANPSAEGRALCSNDKITFYKLQPANFPISFNHALNRLIHLQNYGDVVEVVVVVDVVAEVVVEVVVVAVTTVKLAATLVIPDKVAVILAAPAATPVAKPLEEMVATPVVSLAQVT